MRHLSAQLRPQRPWGACGLVGVILLLACLCIPAWAQAQDSLQLSSVSELSATRLASEVYSDGEPVNPPPKLVFCYQGKVPDTRLVVVDKSRQRIMVFRYLGQMILEYEYPSVTGVNFGHKVKKGDERTPVGIYFTTHRYQDNKITIFGKKAIHLNYPNPLDQVEGRRGDGIYIHGTNSELKDRSTNGCIAMRNGDLDKLAPLIKEHLTPVVVVERLNLADLNDRVMACRELRKLEGMKLDRMKAQLRPHLAMATINKSIRRKLDQLTPRVARLGNGKGSKVKVETTGYILLGLGQQWVLVAEQTVTGPRHRKISLVRRYYLRGPRPSQAQMVRQAWVVPSLTAARRLASWAPAIRVAAAHPRPKPVKVNADQEVRRMLSGWLRAWQRKNLRAYIAYYDHRFRTGDMDRRAWRRHKAYLNRVYKKIRVRASDIRIEVKGNRALVRFVQHYRSDWHRDVGLKELKLVRRRSGWRIISETWSELPGRAGSKAAQGRSS